MEVVITIKDEYVGDIMSDIPQRRGSVVGMEPVGNGKTAITAQIPEAEIIKYTIDLKAMTQGSGYFTRRFIRYDDVPSNLVDKIVAEYKKIIKKIVLDKIVQYYFLYSLIKSKK